MVGERRAFYRTVRTNPPTEDDFLSNWAQHARDLRAGRTPREVPDTGDALHMWSGISVYDNETQASRQALRYGLGGFLACMEIPLGVAIRIEKTGGRHHFTLWGSPAALLACVQSISQVQRGGSDGLRIIRPGHG